MAERRMFFEEPHGDSGWPQQRRLSVRRYFPDPWWSRLKRGLLALAGVAVAIAGGVSAPGTGGRVLTDVSLLFFLTALTSPVWHEVERDVAGKIRWREMLSRVLWRASVVLLYGAVAGLTVYRWFFLHGDMAGAHAGTAVGDTCLLLVIIPPMLGPLLWRLFPDGLRRVERTARLLEELNGSARVKPGRNRLELSPRAATPRAMAAEARSQVEFDPELGASGRPKPQNEFLPGTSRSRSAELRPRPAARLGSTVEWADRKFTVTDYRGFTRTFLPARLPAAGGDGKATMAVPWGVAEIVLLETQTRLDRTRARALRKSSLLFLDERGYCFLDVAQVWFSWREVMGIAAAAGVVFRSYSVDCVGDNATRIQNLMFPRCPDSQTFIR